MLQKIVSIMLTQPNYNDVLNILQDYMLTGKCLIKSTKNKLRELSSEKKQKNNLNFIVAEPASLTRTEKVITTTANVSANVSTSANVSANVSANDSNNVSISASNDRTNDSASISANKKMNKDILFYPEEKDALFWCYFILKNGLSAYEYPNATSFVNEKTEKFKCVQLLRDNKSALKTNKIKNLKEDVEDDLANKERIGMKTFIALCIVSKINVLYIHNRKCFELIHDENEPIHLVQCNSKPYLKYWGQLNIDKAHVELYRNTLFKWESVDKPLKAIGSYKSDELLELCIRLVFGDDSTTNALNKQNLKKKTKKELYELLIQNL